MAERTFAIDSRCEPLDEPRYWLVWSRLAAAAMSPMANHCYGREQLLCGEMMANLSF